MRASPPFQASLHRFGIWRAAMLVLALLCLSTVAAWLVTRERPPSVMLLIASGLGVVAVIWMAYLSSDLSPVSLHWDGQLWRLGRPDADRDTYTTGDLMVAIDLGPWMLLRFSPMSLLPMTTPRVGSVWVPAQRWGGETYWHGLRCAVYSPREPHPSTAAVPAKETAATIGPTVDC